MKPCSDCIEMDGKIVCTMNCGPAVPVKDDPLGIEFARKVAGGHTKLTQDLIKSPNYESAYAKEVMLHAVTQFELKEAKVNIEQLKSYQANYEHATQIERADFINCLLAADSLLKNRGVGSSDPVRERIGCILRQSSKSEGPA